MSKTGITYINPEEAVHPLRLKLDEDEIRNVFSRLEENDLTLTAEELEAANDWLYDYIAAEKQTHEGVTTLQ